jgi:DNA-binding transcriptional MerR regulator
LRGKRLGWSLSEIRESFDLYDSSLGEEAQLLLMLEKLRQRRDSLMEQQKDIDNALQDLERIADDAEQALQDIQSGQPRLGHG